MVVNAGVIQPMVSLRLTLLLHFIKIPTFNYFDLLRVTIEQFKLMGYR